MIGGDRRGVGGRVEVGGVYPGGVAFERSAAVDEEVSGALEALAQVKVGVFLGVEAGRPEVHPHLCHCSAVFPGVQGQSRGAVRSRGLRGRGLAQGTDSWLAAVDWWWTGLICAGQAVDWVNRC